MVKQLDFKKPTQDDLAYIAANMWHEDVAELVAGDNADILDVLNESVEKSTVSVVASYEGAPLVIYGFRAGSILSDKAIVWMLTTTDSKKHGREFMHYTRKVVKAMLTEHGHLYNYVHGKNKRSIKWLKALGFTINEPMPHPITGELFHHFSIERGEYV